MAQDGVTPGGGATEGQARFGLLGRTLGHSWSPLIHARLGSTPYDLIELEPDEVAPFVREDASWRGLNVTIPYKRDAARLADERSGRVERLGVANTLVRRPDGSIYADNTDVLGFGWMLESFCRERLGLEGAFALAGADVLVLGDGGASQAVQAALEDTGAHVSVISRHGDDGYEGLPERHPHALLVVNTTPVGMYPKCPATVVPERDLAALTELRGVLDVVYNPRRTGICLAAERLGLPWQSGLAMLVAQALFSSEQFQGARLDRSLVGAVEKEICDQTENVVLIGMPGVGKTTTGRALAHLLGRPFVDLDDAFRLEFGTAAADFIREHGEAEFRARETQVAADYGSRSSLVVACGGGIVTQPRNYDLLHQNGTIVQLDRPADQLSQANRPLSQARGIQALARERMPLYRAWADLVQPCTGSAAGDARAIATALGLFAR